MYSSTRIGLMSLDGYKKTSPLDWCSDHDWKQYLSPASLEKLEKINVPTRNTNFTVLCYTWSINGSQADKLSGIANQMCPLFQLCVDMIQGSTDPVYQQGFQEMLLHEKKVVTPEYDYTGAVVLTKEDTNQFLFLGALAHDVWEMLKHSFLGHVCYHHIDVFVAFYMRECNGTPLIVDVMTEVVDNRTQWDIVVSALGKSPPEDFYVYLSGVYQLR
jgi:hypothetical protein